MFQNKNNQIISKKIIINNSVCMTCLVNQLKMLNSLIMEKSFGVEVFLILILMKDMESSIQ